MDSRSNPNSTSADLAEVHALFERQVKAENDHDLAGIASVLAEEQDSEDPRVMFVARVGRFAGREAVLRRFEGNFSGTWAFHPDMTQFHAVLLAPDVIHLDVPTEVTVGASDQPARTAHFIVNQIAVRTASGWRFAAIIPVPAE